MDAEKGTKGRIDRILVGAPIAVGERVLRPVTRAGGWARGGDGEQGRGFGGWLRLQPLEVRVSEPGRDDYTVAVADPTGDAVRRMALLGFVVAAASTLLLLVGILLRPRPWGRLARRESRNVA
jgi:hypothetical protein